MKEGLPSFNEGGQEKPRKEQIRDELMQIERQILDCKIHPKKHEANEVEDLHHRQEELLAELQVLENEK